MTYAWPFSHTRDSLVAVAILYGCVPCFVHFVTLKSPQQLTATSYRFRISSGIFVAIMAAPVVRMGKVTEVGMRTGMAFTVMSLGALAGPPISGAILDHTGELKNVGYYAGAPMSFILRLLDRVADPGRA